MIDGPTIAALCIYTEAAGEPYEGKVAVGIVVANRTALHYSSDGTIAGTVLSPNQFSDFYFDFVDGRYQRICHTPAQAELRAETILVKARAQPIWDDCVRAWADATAWENGGSLSFTPGPAFAGLTKRTVLYYNPRVSAAPAWADPVKRDAVIFHHEFFHA